MTEPLTAPPAQPGGEPDAYEVLGVSPRAEDVVIRAAYRSLLNKYTTPGRLPDDPAGDDRKVREVQAAYDHVKDPATRRAYDQRRLDAVVPPTAPPLPGPMPPTEPLPPVAEPAAPTPPVPVLAARRRGPPVWALALGLAALAAVAVGAITMMRRPTGPAQTADAGALSVQPQKPAVVAVLPARPLPCYVDGKSVGTLPLADCAARNGVATGPLDVGLTEAKGHAGVTPAAAPASQPPAEPQTVAEAAPPPAPVHPAAAPVPAPVPAPAPIPAPQLARAQPSPPSTPASPDAGPPGVPQSMATVRAFYEALGDDDGARAASLVEPEKRQSGPLSAARMTRFYGSLRAPLRLTSIYPLDPSTVFVRYQFVGPDGRLCSGAANVATTRRDDQVLVRGIRAFSGC